MFRRDSKPEPATARGSRIAAGEEASTTVIAPGTRVEGTLGGKTDLVVEGEVDGSIELEAALLIRPGALVTGDVAARRVTIEGKVVGTVRGTERVEITAGATLEGDVAAPRVVIADGAFFKGQVEMSGRSGETELPTAATDETAGTAAATTLEG